MEDNIKIIEENFKKNDGNFNIKIKDNTMKYKLDNEKNNCDEVNKLETKKIRNAGVDLIRLIGMYGIIINHLLYLYDKGGMVKYSKYSKYLKILHIFTFWHNNGFVLISGVVGYKSFKYSNLFYLWSEVFFYSISINLYFKIYHRDSYITRDLSKEFFPIIFKGYWFFTAYF